jgi:hypothetical protein
MSTNAAVFYDPLRALVIILKIYLPHYQSFISFQKQNEAPCDDVAGGILSEKIGY